MVLSSAKTKLKQLRKNPQVPCSGSIEVSVDVSSSMAHPFDDSCNCNWCRLVRTASQKSFCESDTQATLNGEGEGEVADCTPQRPQLRRSQPLETPVRIRASGHRRAPIGVVDAGAVTQAGIPMPAPSQPIRAVVDAEAETQPGIPMPAPSPPIAAVGDAEAKTQAGIPMPAPSPPIETVDLTRSRSPLGRIPLVRRRSLAAPAVDEDAPILLSVLSACPRNAPATFCACNPDPRCWASRIKAGQEPCGRHGTSGCPDQAGFGVQASYYEWPVLFFLTLYGVWRRAPYSLEIILVAAMEQLLKMPKIPPVIRHVFNSIAVDYLGVKVEVGTVPLTLFCTRKLKNTDLLDKGLRLSRLPLTAPFDPRQHPYTAEFK